MLCHDGPKTQTGIETLRSIVALHGRGHVTTDRKPRPGLKQRQGRVRTLVDGVTTDRKPRPGLKPRPL